MEDTGHFKILNLHAENVKKLKVIDISPNPQEPAVILSGKNGAGKSSVLDSILWALAGKDTHQDKPIRSGESEASVEIDLGHYIVKRTWTQKGTYLTVKTKDGAKYPSPQDLLNDIIGKIAFDPLAFTRMSDKEQYQNLLGMLDLPLDIEKADAEIAALRDQRLEAGRVVKTKQAACAELEDKIPQDQELPTAEVNVAQLMSELEQLQQMQEQHKRNADNVARLQQELEALEKKVEETRIALNDAQELREASRESNPRPEHIDDVRRRIETASERNKLFNIVQSRAALQDQHNAAKKEYDSFTDKIADKEDLKIKAIASAGLPVLGLSFKDGQVLYNDEPLRQASTAEQIRVSTAIAMAANPKLRVVSIRDGSLLDDDSMAALKQIAKDNDFQLWIEVVNSQDPMSIQIEDGAIAGAEEEEQQAAATA